MTTTSEISMSLAGDGLSRATLLSIRNVAKRFGKNVVLRDISLEVAEGEFLTILGESGSGKTTLLRARARCGWVRSDWIASLRIGAA
jgi:ABC-type Fe3+/spermidine/putrescine transport system ATPase subunit